MFLHYVHFEVVPPRELRVAKRHISPLVGGKREGEGGGGGGGGGRGAIEEEGEGEYNNNIMPLGALHPHTDEVVEPISPLTGREDRRFLQVMLA